MTAIIISQAIADLDVYLTINRPVLLTGPVGVGKTDIVRQAAAKRNWPVIDKRASQMTATDITLPFPDAATGLIKGFVPDWLPRVDRDGPEGILMFDELTDAALSVQAALNQLTLERCTPNYRLPDGWRIVATGNRQIDRAAAGKVSRATANRLALIEVKPDIAALVSHGRSIGIADELLAYIMNAERILKQAGKTGDDLLECVHKYPQGSGSDAVAFLTPRSLFACSPLFSMNLGDSQLSRLLGQNVGDETAEAIVNFLATYRLLPDLNAILANPESAKIHREPSVNFALSVALVSKLTLANVDQIAAYVARLDAGYQAAFWSNAIAKDKAFKETKAHVSYLMARASE